MNGFAICQFSTVRNYDCGFHYTRGQLKINK